MEVRQLRTGGRGRAGWLGVVGGCVGGGVYGSGRDEGGEGNGRGDEETERRRDEVGERLMDGGEG